jgi:formyltetrahydrofolate-dependent phosphoribosylglycinamide formyltransferase
LHLIVMLSGSGTNLQAIIDAIEENSLEAEIRLVASNRRAAYGLVRAEQAGIPTLYFPLKPYREAGKSREEYDAELAEKLLPYEPDLIVLAGWMHVLSPAFLKHFPNKVINLHPALPGMFPGADGIQRAFEAYQRGEIDHSGCMVHYVIPELDAGPVIVHEVVAFLPDDDLESFEALVHDAEHRIIVEAVRIHASRRL